MTVRLGIKLLVVEDDEDNRDLLVHAFETQGYDVTGVATATEGLEALRRGATHAVVTDNSLPPGETGAWMLERAAAEGLLAKVGAVMYSADTKPKVPEGVYVVRKPADLNDLFHTTERALTQARGAEMVRARGELERFSTPPSAAAAGSGAQAPPIVELVLYVTDSPASLRAVRNLQRLLSEYEDGVNLRVFDLSRDPCEAECTVDRIAFTPTLVKRSPGPSQRLLGDLQNDRAVHDLLQHAGAEKR